MPETSKEKNAAHDGGGVLVNQKVVLVGRVPFVAQGRVGPHEFPAFGAGFFDCLDLFAGVSAVKFVK